MTRKRLTAAAAGAILTAAVLLTGCSANDSGSGESGSTTADGAAQPQQDRDAAQPQQDQSAAKPQQDQGAATPGDTAAKEKEKAAGGAAQPSVTRAIIKNGSLTLETKDVDKARQQAVGIVAGLRGQVATEDTGSEADGSITRANLVLKVPTSSYETAVQRLSALGTRKQIKQESTDVTEQVVDVESRISTQRASLNRVRVLLAKATTIGEIVSVEAELTRREADLEALLAKQKALAGQTELATLTLTVYQTPEQNTVIQEPTDERGFLVGLRDGWDAFSSAVAALATVFGALLPFLVAIALIGGPLWLLRRRLRRTPAPATAGAPLPQHPDNG